MTALDSGAFKRTLTFLLIVVIVLSGVLYQRHYHQKKAHYRRLIIKYGPEYDGKELSDYEVETITQWVINGHFFGKGRKKFLDSKLRDLQGKSGPT